jgi:serine/threonine-protein kinase RsbW
MGLHRTTSVPGTLAGLTEAVGAADGFCREAGVPDELRRRLLTALDEVLANVVHHALAGAEGTVEMTLSGDQRAVRATVVDPGAPFNPLLAPEADTTSPLEARRVGGLGIALVRALVDEVAYERRGNRNRLTLTWRLARGSSSESTDADH